MARALLITFKNYVYDARTRRHAEGLAERGDEVDVICLVDGVVGQRKGINLITLGTRRYRGSHRARYLRSYLRFFITAMFIALRRSITKPYDIVIVGTMPDALVLCALPTKLFGSKIILDMRDTMPELYREKFGTGWHDLGARLLMMQERVSAWLADAVLAVHEPHRRRLEQAKIPADKIAVVMNSPDPRIFVSHRNGRGASQAPFTLVFHGTLTRRLGLDVGLQALSLLRDRCPRLHMLVLGVDDDGCLADLRSLVKTLKLDSQVTFAERVPVPDLPLALSQATVGLVPNRATSATELMLPVKLLEYAMLGIPVIAPQLTAIQYYFDDKAVRFFAPDDPHDLSVAIEELYHSPTRCVELSQRASEIIKRIDWLHERTEYYRVVDLLVGENASR